MRRDVHCMGGVFGNAKCLVQCGARRDVGIAGRATRCGTKAGLAMVVVVKMAWLCFGSLCKCGASQPEDILQAGLSCLPLNSAPVRQTQHLACICILVQVVCVAWRLRRQRANALEDARLEKV